MPVQQQHHQQQQQQQRQQSIKILTGVLLFNKKNSETEYSY